MLSTRIKFLLTLWLLAEVGTFILLVDLIGFGNTFLLGLATTLLGLSLLKRAGRSVMQTMRDRLDRAVPSGALLDDTLATIGAIALLVPGFLSDAIGLFLAVPPVRKEIARLVGGRRGFPIPSSRSGPSRHGPHVIDLDRDQWHPTEATPTTTPRG